MGYTGLKAILIVTIGIIGWCDKAMFDSVSSFTINDITYSYTKIYQNKIIKILKKFVVTNIKFVVTNLRIVMSTFFKTINIKFNHYS